MSILHSIKYVFYGIGMVNIRIIISLSDCSKSIYYNLEAEYRFTCTGMMENSADTEEMRLIESHICLHYLLDCPF